jgi:hypothetical protein
MDGKNTPLSLSTNAMTSRAGDPNYAEQPTHTTFSRSHGCSTFTEAIPAAVAA